MGLKDLDAKVVPRLATWLRSTLDRAADRLARARGVVAAGGQRLVDPSHPGALQRLDDRYASSGPLSLLRDVPQLGLLLVASVFLAAAGFALARSGPESVRERQQLEQEEALPLTLGAPVGADVDDHLAAARARAVELAEETPDTRYLSLVSVRDELTVEQLSSLTVESELVVKKVYVRAPVAGQPEPFEVDPGEDAARTLSALFAETARREAEEQRELLSLAKSLEGATSEDEKAAKALNEADARTAGEEAAAYRTSCACVLAVVVEGPASQLAELLSLPLVRGVEVAPRDAVLTALTVTPLPPDVTGTVPEPPQ